MNLLNLVSLKKWKNKKIEIMYWHILRNIYNYSCEGDRKVKIELTRVLRKLAFLKLTYGVFSNTCNYISANCDNTWKSKKPRD